MQAPFTVLGALRRFLPDHRNAGLPLSPDQRRALRAMDQCRTPALGGQVFACVGSCPDLHFAWHSCNHKACPQCGRAASARWIRTQLTRLVQAPYFLVTFTLPEQLRGLFFGPFAKEAFDLFFTAVHRALSEKLAAAPRLRATTSGFIAVLHTWNQQLGFHPHIHCVVPGAGLNARGRFVRVRKPGFLVHRPHLQAAFRQHLHLLFTARDWQVDPAVWGRDWGVHIQPAGSGASALKYLGTYVARTGIEDRRIVNVADDSVSFRWKNRQAGNRREVLTLPGPEFVRRYLSHVLPRGLRSIRHYGFCHPRAKASRLRVQLHSGAAVDLGASPPPPTPAATTTPVCPCCRQPMRLVATVKRSPRERGPPTINLCLPPAPSV